MSFLSDIVVVPTYDSNRRLAGQIKTELEEFLEVKNNYGQQKIIIFRPTGRPADEFKEAVSPILENCSSVYLVVAFSGQKKDISELVPYGLRDKVMKTVVIYIQSGQLVGSDSPWYNSNKDELKTLATLLSKDYNVPSDPPGPSTTFDSPSSSVDYCLVLGDAKLLGKAVNLLRDFPQGVCLKDLLAMMSFDVKETELNFVLTHATSVFTCEGKGEGRESVVKLADSFLNDLAEIRAGEPYKESVSRTHQTGGTGRGDSKIQTRNVSLSDVTKFVEKVRQSPQLLDQSLMNLIQSELNIQGDLMDRLARIVHTPRQGCSDPALSQAGAQISPDVFLNFMESVSIELDDELKQKLERELGMTYRTLLQGLEKVCQRVRSGMGK